MLFYGRTNVDYPEIATEDHSVLRHCDAMTGLVLGERLSRPYVQGDQNPQPLCIILILLLVELENGSCEGSGLLEVRNTDILQLQGRQDSGR